MSSHHRQPPPTMLSKLFPPALSTRLYLNPTSLTIICLLQLVLISNLIYFQCIIIRFSRPILLASNLILFAVQVHIVAITLFFESTHDRLHRSVSTSLVVNLITELAYTAQIMATTGPASGVHILLLGSYLNSLSCSLLLFLLCNRWIIRRELENLLLQRPIEAFHVRLLRCILTILLAACLAFCFRHFDYHNFSLIPLLLLHQLCGIIGLLFDLPLLRMLYLTIPLKLVLFFAFHLVVSMLSQLPIDNSDDHIRIGAVVAGGLIWLLTWLYYEYCMMSSS